MNLFPDSELDRLAPLKVPGAEPKTPDFIPDASSAPGNRVTDFIPEAAGVPQAKTPDFIPEMPLESLAPEQKAAADRVDPLLAKRQAAQVEVERSMPGEVAASLGRGAIGLAKLPLQLAKIAGSDVLQSDTVKNLTEPVITGLEQVAESPALKPGKAAGGPPVELDRIFQDPGGVSRQIAANIANPYFWASQLPEGAMSTVPYFFGSWIARTGAAALKYGKLVNAANRAAQAAEVAGDAGALAAATAKMTEYGTKLARIGRMGGYGMAMAQEAASAEQNLREWELQKGKEVPWLTRNIVMLVGGAAAGAFEAMSLERIFAGKKGLTLTRKMLDSIITEGTTEGAQELVANAFKKYGYDPDQKLTENIVESALVGAALGGVFGGAEKFSEYRQHIRELREKADAEQRERQAQPWTPPAVEPWEEAPMAPPPSPFGPPPREEIPPPPPYRIIEPGERPPAITQTEPEGGSPIVDQFGRPIYRSALEVALRKEPWERNALEKWLVDQATTGKTVMPETKGAGVVLGPQGEVVAGPGAPAPEPMGTPSMEIETAVETSETAPKTIARSEIPDLRTRVSQLAAAVDETGDPRAAQELNRILIANQQEIGDLFRVPEEERPGLKPVADRLDTLIRQVEESGDPAAARELHEILAANQDVLSGVTQWEIRKAAGREPEPMVPSSLEVKEVATPEPEGEPPADTLAEVDQQKAEGTNQLESMPQGARLTAPEYLGGSLAGTWRRTNLAGDSFWVNEKTGEHKTSESFAIFLKDWGIEEPRRGLPGAQVQATTARGTTVDAQYEVMDVNDLVTSHDDALGLNPAFPRELQPRERGRVGSQLQIGQIEQNLQPAFLGESPQAAEGAPIIWSDNLVESGNARTIAVRRLYGRQRAEVYRQWLRENAHHFGIAPDQIDQVQNPILVRRRLTDVDRKQFVREANEATVAAMSAVEVARSDAAVLKDLDILQNFISNDKGLISTSDNLSFINRFMEKVVGPTERNRYATAKGLLNQDGERRIRNALFALAFGGAAALEKLAESTDDNARNITGAMTMVAARLASINKEIAKGNLYDLNITREIAQAADILQSLREQGQTVEWFLAQQKLFEDTDPLVADLLQVFARFSRSRVKLTAIFNAYADALEALGNPRQMQLLGPKIDITKAELLQIALNQVEQSHGKGTEPLPVDVQQGAPPSGPVGDEETGEASGPEAGQAGGTEGTTPVVPEEEVGGGFDLTGGKPKATPFKTRLKELQDEYSDIDLDRAATVLRAFPNAENGQIVNMAADPEMFSQAARGNLSAEERRLLLEKAATMGQQVVLPGLGERAGGPFDQEPEPLHHHCACRPKDRGQILPGREYPRPRGNGRFSQNRVNHAGQYQWRR